MLFTPPFFDLFTEAFTFAPFLDVCWPEKEICLDGSLDGFFAALMIR